ncbi:protein SAWADEE HOMEODOMAIN HOMOLOG 1 [Humulus lupulus]|uniref:protein SAWADEE HOMEODOMAIN HOMOLOG 1 n=1 Tax=Humulus lupulus TaxID=3486 RepID=UPI002B416FF7|nr:protein SAWADEE HOMEODOMAIN HOMOLOG 1 [Humulus lupulus]
MAMAKFDKRGSRNAEKFSSVFTLAEILEMDTLYTEIEEQSLGQQFCQDLAMSFSGAASRSGKSTVTWEQVQKWFWDKHKTLHPESSSPAALDLVVDLNPSTPNNPPESPKKTIQGDSVTSFHELACEARPAKDDNTTSFHELAFEARSAKGDNIMSFHELAFEARSAKDNAWYDVASFLTYRVVITGELEVRVRFSGYHKEDDEWVNVRTRVRERSIPLEPSECHKVKVGDLVLCFQERDDHAVYHDAYVVAIHRKQHDLNSCQCSFVVRYDDDNTQENVHLGRICCRPAGSGSLANANTQNEICKDENWKMSFLY